MTKFRRAKEIPKTEEKEPASLRLRKSLKAELVREAKAGGLSLSELLEAILEDYGRFLKSKEK